jgi:hypothetical protein
MVEPLIYILLKMVNVNIYEYFALQYFCLADVNIQNMVVVNILEQCEYSRHD